MSLFRSRILRTNLFAVALLLPRMALAQDVQYAQPRDIYGPTRDSGFPVKGVDTRRVDPRYFRTLVAYETDQQPGTIVIDPAQHFLYLVLGDGQAIRYGVGVGREGFAWSGAAEIGAKRDWPDWYPPKEMFARQPEIRSAMSKLPSGLGMHGGPANPLGARAMYLFQNGRDTLFRIHGTLEPYTIGGNVSSGCIRMMNQDVMDLYKRVGVGTKVVVLGYAHPENRPIARSRKIHGTPVAIQTDAPDRAAAAPAVEGLDDQGR